MVKEGFCHESVHKQQVFASKKTHSYWPKKAPHQRITKLYGKTRGLVAEVARGSCGRYGVGRVTSAVTVIETEIDMLRDL